MKNKKITKKIINNQYFYLNTAFGGSAVSRPFTAL